MKKTIKTKEWVKLLGVKIDCNLNFDIHIGEICNKAAGQLNAIFRLQRYLSSDTKKLLINSFIYCHFNYCPLVWHFTTAKSKLKIEKVQERALRFILNDFASPYDHILSITGKSKMEINRLRSLCIEIYKTLNRINPEYMSTIFKQTLNRTSPRFSYNIEVNKPKQVRFGERSLRSLGPKIWNNLPKQLKSSENLEIFKLNLKSWGAPGHCMCTSCRI